MIRSLRTRLVLILLALILAAWIASGFLAFLFVSRVMQEQVDNQLAQYAGLVNYITRVFSRQLDEGEPLSEPWLSGQFETAHLQPMVIDAPVGEKLDPALNIWLGDNLIAVMADSPRFQRPAEEGYSLSVVGSEQVRWRVLSRYDAATELWVQVGIELDDARTAMLRNLGRTLLPLLLVLPLTVALLYFGVSRGLRPLAALADQIARRNQDLLDPVDSSDVPAELQGVVSSLNGLLQRLALALEGEQRFTANAAHELLTPLAAIKTEVQLCQLQLGDARGIAMLARIAQRVDRASHTVEQLMTLARLDPGLPAPRQPVPLRSLLAEALADTGHLAEQRALHVDLAEGEEVIVAGNSEALAILLRNLLVNAFRYASESSTVTIALSSGNSPGLEISNDCEPLARDEFKRINERFYRVPGSPGQGAGLGLSIAARIASLHAARLLIGPREDKRGFRVHILFLPHEVSAWPRPLTRERGRPRSDPGGLR